jgi:hypothetical protein
MTIKNYTILLRDILNWALPMRFTSTFKEVSKPKVAKQRDYKKEYREYHGTPEQKKRRADRNRANRQAKREGRIRKGDGKEVDHVGFHRKGRLKNVPTRVVSRAANRKRQPPRP